MTKTKTINTCSALLTSALVVIAVAILPSHAFAQTADSKAKTETASPSLSQLQLKNAQIKQVVKDAFATTHDGWSSDEVILQPELNAKFLTECRKGVSDVSDERFNWTLLGLRKSGNLKIKSTRRNNSTVNQVVPIAEIAARSLQDEFKVSIDRLMANPATRKRFDAEVKSIDKNVNTYLARKAAFNLRKARRLKPELISRIAEWGREIVTISAKEASQLPDLVPAKPGVYIFRDKTGYLYIGQTDNLRTRLRSHLDESHSKSLASYLKAKGANGISIELHAFDPKSRASETRVRRAYESELIQSRKPRFNISE